MKYWYTKNNLLFSLIAAPFSLIFFCIVKLRFYLYKFGFLKSYRLPVPVVIIGNITVGGVGKTPITKHIAKELIRANLKVGVILRGYKGDNAVARVVTKDDVSQDVGDEALIYANNNIPVAIGRNRYHAGLALLKQYPDIQIVLADDGLQHYRLHRDYEIAVLDKNLLFGNGHLLPWGPLREPKSRLKSVDSIIINLGTETELPANFLEKHLLFLHNVIASKPVIANEVKQSQMSFLRRQESTSNNHSPTITTHTLTLDKIYSPIKDCTISIDELKQLNVTAMAAIGNPERFFNFLKHHDIHLQKTIVFPDHHHYTASDTPKTDRIILVTEKDYTKLAKFKNPNIYVVMVNSTFNNNIILENILDPSTNRQNKLTQPHHQIKD